MLALYQLRLAPPFSTAYLTGRAARFWLQSMSPSTICAMRPMKSTISMVRMIGFFAMNSAPVLKVTPPSLKKMKELRVTCTTKKLIRKRPVRAIQNFLTSDEPNRP